MPRPLAVAILLLCIAGMSACERATYNPEWATRPYPFELHTTHTRDIQVFRKDTTIELVNATAATYSNFDLWINQRYVRHVDELPAGGSLKLSLWDFKDEYGYTFYAGGFFRTREPAPVRMVEIQSAEGPLFALITIRAEPVVASATPGR